MTKLKGIIQKSIATCLFVLCNLFVNAQESVAAAKQDFMRSNGKIYVVIAVVVVIVTGLFVYVWSIDRKISKMEEES